MIEIEGLTKAFHTPTGDTQLAVNDISLTVRPGEIFGLLGANGAGKTTTLRILCTVLKPTAGFASIAGYDVASQPGQVRRSIGFLSANTGVYDRMTPWEMVHYYGRLYGLDVSLLTQRQEDLFESLQMTEFRDVPCGKLSTGMKQKVSIARALIHDPPVLIFDEPTSGLDVLIQRAVLRGIADLREQGKTILFSTHVMSEVEKLCDRVAILSKGSIVAMGSLPELREQFQQTDLEELFFSLVS